VPSLTYGLETQARIFSLLLFRRNLPLRRGSPACSRFISGAWVLLCETSYPSAAGRFPVHVRSNRKSSPVIPHP